MEYPQLGKPDALMEANQILFQVYKRQREQLKELTNLLTDLIDGVEGEQDVKPIIDKAKRYLLIDTNLSMEYLDD